MAGFLMDVLLNKIGESAFPMLLNGLIGVSSPNRVDVQHARYDAQTVRPVVPYRAPVPYTGGRVRALFIGINYKGTRNELSGCVNDVDQMIGTLQRIAFPITECCILVDQPNFPNFSAMPTRANIIKHLAWLVSGVRPGDVLFLHYSGHGGQSKSRSDQEEEYDQSWIPLDYETEGGILDDDLFNLLVRDLPYGVRMTCVFDCCHSASMLDLPFSFVGRRGVSFHPSNCQMEQVRRSNFSAGDVVLFSGCDDAGTSADVRNTWRTKAGGAATQSFTWALVYTKGYRYIDMLLKTRDILLSKNYKQVPQLTSSKPLDLYKPFSLFGSITVNEQQMQSLVPQQFHYQTYNLQTAPPMPYPPQPSPQPVNRWPSQYPQVQPYPPPPPPPPPQMAQAFTAPTREQYCYNPAQGAVAYANTHVPRSVPASSQQIYGSMPRSNDPRSPNFRY